MRDHGNGRFVLACLTVFLMLQAGAALGQSDDAEWEPITEERLLDPQDGDWMSYRRTYDVTGFSPLDQIDRDNVSDLRLVWSWSMRDNSRWVPTPIVANGLMYVSEGSGRVTAFDVLSGDVGWVYTRSYPEDIEQSQALGRHRGVSVLGDTVYFGAADAVLVALDALTGEQRWEVSTGDYTTGPGPQPPAARRGREGRPWASPAVTGVGAAPSSRTTPRRASTSGLPTRCRGPASRVTRPGPSARFRRWAAWRGAPSATTRNSASSTWAPGSRRPWASTLRGPGDALYTNCILALDIDTGEIEWYFQVVPADNWDLDATAESMLVDLEIGGVEHKALIETSKIGWGVVLDRETGRFIDAFRTGYDNIITGWTDTGSPIYNPEQIPTLEDVDSDKIFEVCPHLHGARNLNSASYSPETGLYYVGINNACMDVTFVSEEYVPGRVFRGMGSRVKMVPGYDYIGEFVAFNPVTGERAWDYRFDSGAPMTAAALSTAGGLVFGGTADRRLFALDAEDGEMLWETRLNGDISGAPVTFEVDGRQYLAVGAGGRIGQTTSYARLTGITLPQGSGVIWVFALPE